MDECTALKLFKWKELNDAKYLLNTPKRCHSCPNDKLKECMENNWTNTGRSIEDLKSVTILINLPNAEHIDIVPTETNEEED